MSGLHLHRSTFGLALISAAALAFEISLTRLFAVQQFHHFAFVVVSLAVMGFAASGALLAVRSRSPSPALLASLFALAVGLSYLTINYLPFDSYSIAWDRRQVGVLLVYFLTAGLPFVFAGWTIGAKLAEAGTEAHRPYAANLAGSALGCPAALGAMALLGGEGAAALAAVLGFGAALAFTPRPAVRLLLAALAAPALVFAIRRPETLTLNLSPYKPLVTAQLTPSARTTLTRWSAAQRVDVVESGAVHVLPGLSFNAGITPPPQAAFFVDGDGPIPITALSPDDPDAAALADHMPTGIAYQLRRGGRALIVNPGAGLEAILALAAGADQVALARDDPLIFEVLAGPYAEFSRGLLDHPRLRPLRRPSRGALQASAERYDLIVFALSDPFRPITSGAFSLTEYYPLTVEALGEAYGRLADDGLLVLQRWLGTPPSESARAWATLLDAVEGFGVHDPTGDLIAFRDMRTATLIAARRPFTTDELQRTRTFLDANGYDPIFLPDLKAEELNRHNRLPEDVYHQLFVALLQNPEATLAEYDFDLHPPTDDRPYFFHFFRWRQTPQVLATLGLTWQPFGGSGYLVLLALLGMMIVLALPLILIPLFAVHARGAHRWPRPAALLYFACLGAGYLLVEVPLIQQLTLLLDRPTLSLAVVLFTLLLASGVGSLLSPRLRLEAALTALVTTLVLTTAMTPTLVHMALPWSLTPRLALAVGLLTPAGVLMGVPFAAGLRALENQASGSIPWAWGVNGALSGVSGVLAAMIALAFGFRATLALGAVAYLGAWAGARRWMGRAPTRLRRADRS